MGFRRIAACAVIVAFALSSNATSAFAASDRSSPTVPTQLATTVVTSSQVSLAWSASRDNVRVAGYYVYRNKSRIASVTTTAYVDGGLRAATTYSYTVAAFDPSGNVSSQSAALKTTTRAAIPNDTSAPSAPGRPIVAARTSSAVTLSWAPSTDNVAVVGYRVQRDHSQIATSTSASFTDSGLSAGTNYTYTVAAVDAAGNVSATSLPMAARILAPQTSTALSACRAISTPGYYSLTGDLVTENATCIDIAGVADVTVDCAGASITQTGSTAGLPTVRVDGSSRFSILNCSIASVSSTADGVGSAVEVTNSSTGSVLANTFSGRATVRVSSSSGVVVADDRFQDAMYEQFEGTGNRVDRNSFRFPGYAGVALVNIAFGSGNIVSRNSIDGTGGRNSSGPFGFDDGIVVQRETGALITANTISNVYDCGIETLFAITNSTFSDNIITRADVCGIGGWYYSSWSGNTVSGNQVDTAQFLMSFFRVGLLPDETRVHFENNTFSHNVMRNPTSSYGGYIDMDPVDNPSIPVGGLIAGNNVFVGNDFSSSQFAPILWPTSMIVDGGGNKCKAVAFDHDAALTCH